MKLGINLCIPCTPKDPEWVVDESQEDPSQNKKDE